MYVKYQTDMPLGAAPLVNKCEKAYAMLKKGAFAVNKCEKANTMRVLVCQSRSHVKYHADIPWDLHH